MDINLTGKIAIVTGGAGQLGRVMVRTLAQCGADVAIHYHNSAAMALELQDEVRAMGRRAFIVQADITSGDEVNAMRDAVVGALGWPDIVVDNAVIQYLWTTVLEQDAADYESQFRSCVMQNVFMAKAFVPRMVERRCGRFIAINTECAMLNKPNQSAYVSGKRGMDGMLKTLALEVAEYNVTVNQIAPGWTFSDKDRQPGAAIGEDYILHVPMKRRGTDQEIANVVAFLASDLSSFVTGAVIPVCGGTAVSPI